MIQLKQVAFSGGKSVQDNAVTTQHNPQQRMRRFSKDWQFIGPIGLQPDARGRKNHEWCAKMHIKTMVDKRWNENKNDILRTFTVELILRLHGEDAGKKYIGCWYRYKAEDDMIEAVSNITQLPALQCRKESENEETVTPTRYMNIRVGTQIW